jgi:membrane-bound lytic murein transglycosylase
MPTGYTHGVADGKVTDFPTFAMECARAFGALISMRDDYDAPVPDEFQPSDYHAVQLEEARLRLTELQALTPEQAEERAAEAYVKACESNAQFKANTDEKRRRYEAMLEQVRAWEPPTAEHVELKRFMEAQLTDSIRHDCEWQPEEPVRQSWSEWLDDQLKQAHSSIRYHASEDAAERARIAGRNAWVKGLRESLQATGQEASR